MTFVNNGRIMEIQTHPLSFHKLWAQTRFFQIEFAFDLSAWLVLQREHCVRLRSFRVPEGMAIGARNDVRAFIVDQRSLATSVLVSDSIESEANAEK